MPDLTITSFNARWGRSLDDVPFDLADVVAGFGTDVIAVQEVWDPLDGPDPLGAVAARLGYHLTEVPLSGSTVDPTPAITPVPEEATGTWGIALLSRLPVRGVRVVDLGRVVERWDVATRHAILAELDLDGCPVTVAAVHLSFALPNAVAQLRRLHGFLPRHHPSVVVGDCNLWGPAAAALLGGRARAVRGRTWPADRPHSQLDHILPSPELTVVRGRVLPTAGYDHHPIQATHRQA